MANNKQRYINTRFWNDNYVSEKDPIEKLVFIYFLTNEHTNISGVYELPLKIMSVETGIEISMLNKIIPRLKEKVSYLDGKVIIKNFIKHQETKSANVMTGIVNCLKEFDIKWLKNIVDKGLFILPKYYSDTLCIPYVEGRNYLDLDLDSNLDLHSISEQGSQIKKIKKPVKKEEEKHTKEIPLVIKSFEKVNADCKNFYGNKTQRGACSYLIENYTFDRIIAVVEKTLPKTNQMPFFPVITTPLQLKQKWATLESAIRKHQNEKVAVASKNKVAFS